MDALASHRKKDATQKVVSRFATLFLVEGTSSRRCYGHDGLMTSTRLFGKWSRMTCGACPEPCDSQSVAPTRLYLAVADPGIR